jgi:hypothetical protein
LGAIFYFPNQTSSQNINNQRQTYPFCSACGGIVGSRLSFFIQNLQEAPQMYKKRQFPQQPSGQYNPASTAPQSPPQQQPLQTQMQPPVIQQPRQQMAPQQVQQPVAQPPVMPQPPHAQMQPAPNHYQQAPNQSPSPFAAIEYLDGKISKINGKDKVMDFSDALIKALPKDYANLHGCGGRDHAPNSGIRLTCCDFTKGTGASSVTTSVILDVRLCDKLLNVVGAAVNGTLGMAEQLRAVKEFAQANGMVIGWMQAGHPPAYEQLVQLQQMLCNGLMAQDPEGKSGNPVWSHSFQKNNPHKSACKLINGREFTPVSSLHLTYTPSRNYAWTIRVANFLAPINRQENGASSHNSKEAIEKKEVMISVTTDDLYEALCDVSHYIHTWEARMVPLVNAACNERDRRAAIARQQRATTQQ